MFQRNELVGCGRPNDYGWWCELCVAAVSLTEGTKSTEPAVVRSIDLREPSFSVTFVSSVRKKEPAQTWCDGELITGETPVSQWCAVRRCSRITNPHTMIFVGIHLG